METMNERLNKNNHKSLSSGLLSIGALKAQVLLKKSMGETLVQEKSPKISNDSKLSSGGSKFMRLGLLLIIKPS